MKQELWDAGVRAIIKTGAALDAWEADKENAGKQRAVNDGLHACFTALSDLVTAHLEEIKQEDQQAKPRVPTLEDFEAAPEGTVAVDHHEDGPFDLRWKKAADGKWHCGWEEQGGWRQGHGTVPSDGMALGAKRDGTVLIYPEGKKP